MVANIQKVVAKLDSNENTKPKSNDGSKVFFLPVVSARNPQKCPLTTIPMKLMAVSTPLCSIVQFISHCETGITKITLDDSKYICVSTKPEIVKRNASKFPNSKNVCNFVMKCERIKFNRKPH
ncbi:hypothetical protein ACFFRR_001539 [Megaselia abdita]